jgi:hypothetical protein
LARIILANRRPSRTGVGTKDALSVYDIATSKEQAELTLALMKKRAAFHRDMYKTHSYSEIQTDPMIKRLLTFTPSQQ